MRAHDKSSKGGRVFENNIYIYIYKVKIYLQNIQNIDKTYIGRNHIYVIIFSKYYETFRFCNNTYKVYDFFKKYIAGHFVYFEIYVIYEEFR